MLSLYLLQVFLSQNALGQKKTIQETEVLKLAVFPQKMRMLWEYLLWKMVIKLRSNEEESRLNTHSWEQAFFFLKWVPTILFAFPASERVHQVIFFPLIFKFLFTFSLQ